MALKVTRDEEHSGRTSNVREHVLRPAFSIRRVISSMELHRVRDIAHSRLHAELRLPLNAPLVSQKGNFYPPAGIRPRIEVME
jgi:hypothetical protein